MPSSATGPRSWMPAPSPRGVDGTAFEWQLPSAVWPPNIASPSPRTRECGWHIHSLACPRRIGHRLASALGTPPVPGTLWRSSHCSKETVRPMVRMASCGRWKGARCRREDWSISSCRPVTSGTTSNSPDRTSVASGRRWNWRTGSIEPVTLGATPHRRRRCTNCRVTGTRTVWTRIGSPLPPKWRRRSFAGTGSPASSGASADRRRSKSGANSPVRSYHGVSPDATPGLT